MEQINKQHKLKVVHLNFADKYGGGAAKAVWRIHESLISIGLDSKVFLFRSKEKDSNIIKVISENASDTKKFKYKLICLLSKKKVAKMKSNNSILHSINRYGILKAKDINKLDADIIHIHWIGYEYIKIEELKKIEKPVVFHLHDLWLLLGSEHYPLDVNDTRYLSEYSTSSRHKDHKGVDLDKATYIRKKRIFKNIKANIISNSKWSNSYVKKSKLFDEIKSTVIPIPIDLDVFVPHDKISVRRKLNLPEQKKIILFGAVGGINDVRKGFSLLLEALRKVNLTSESTEIIIFGGEKPNNAPDFGYKTTYLGFIKDESVLTLYYNAVDVYLNPSLMETFGQTTLESISCGTPVVAYNYSGTTDIIDHKKNGYLAKPFCSDDYAKGIEFCLQEGLRIHCIEKSKRFEKSKVAHELKDFYKSVISQYKSKLQIN